MTTRSSNRTQRGGFALGLIVGLLAGLAIALGVALYVAKVPSPFVNKVPQRTADQDAAEAEKNKNWDPNTPLYGKNPARPSAVASGVVAPPLSAAASEPAAQQPAFVARSPASSGSTRDPAALLADKASPAASRVAATNAPVIDTTLSAKSGAEPFSYFLQVGAYARPEDAEEQRARVAMMGFAAKVSERDQSGRTVYRVRVGPYDRKEDVDLAKDKLDGASVETALVRVQK